MKKKVTLKNIVWKEGKYYVAQCLNVDISSFGKTEKLALKNLNEALELYFEDVRSHRINEVTTPVIHSTLFHYA